MAQRIVTIYNPEGKPEKHLRANAVDLTRHCGYAWQPGKVLSPVDPAPIPKEKNVDPLADKVNEDDNEDEDEDEDDTDPVSESDPDSESTESEFDALKAKAESLGIKVTGNATENSLAKKIAAAEKKASE